MTTAVDCKRSLEIEIPLEEVERATQRATETLRQKARLPGFRPGKAPAGLVKSKFQAEIRQEVIEHLLPQAFRQRAEQDNLQIVGTPDITDLHFDPGQPIRFKAEFEIAPDFELGQYHGLPVKYAEPTVAEEDIDKRIESIRETKAEYVNIDPRPIENGDFVIVSLKTVAGVAEEIVQDELMLHVGDEETLPAFTENLLGASPEDRKEFDITYPDDYGQEKLAGKTVRFEMVPKVIRRKELPVLDDEFARDLGDYQALAELREAVRKAIFQEKQFSAQQDAKNALIDTLVDSHDFPVPETYVDRQIENQVRSRLSNLASQGVDPNSLKLDWAKVKESQQEKAQRNVKASLILEKIADREGIHATEEEVDREVQRFAKQEREPVAAVRAKLEKEGVLGRIASQLQTEKTVDLLFEKALKEA